MIRTLLKFRNSDSTLDLNDHLSKFFKRGIVDGGSVVPVASTLAVDITPFKLIGFDGMVVMETSEITRLSVSAGVTNVIVFKSQYVHNDDPIFGFEVLELSDYQAAADKDYLTVFATITLSAGAIEVLNSNIDYSSRDVVDPVGRLVFRGTSTSAVALPGTGNRPGDTYSITSGLGDAPEVHIWNGTNWINVTNTILLASLLNAHRNNLFPNEIHLTNDQADAVLGTFGTPSDLNRFVTDTDPRVPTLDQAKALLGLPASPIPSLSNPYVTAAYALAEPNAKAFGANPGGALVISSGEGPIYVGTGGVGSAIQYFKIYHASLPREFLNSNGQAVTVTGVFKDIGLTQALIPSTEPTIIADNGFYSGSLYITYNNSIDLSCRLLYGKKEGFGSIDRGAFLVPNPNDAQTSAETLLRLQAISGRKFDDPVQPLEDNVSLRNSIVNLRRYGNATTAADLVLDSSEFARLRKIPEFALDFPKLTGERTIFAGNVEYTVSNSLVSVQNFDSYYVANTPDLSSIAIISYTSAANLTNAKPGHLFVDGVGRRFRVLAVKTSGNGSLMLYTGGNSVSSVLTTGAGAVLQANNPRQLEILGDHSTSMYREFIQVQSVSPDTSYIEDLPPGGSYVGTGSLFSMIGTALLPNQGNPSGAPSGRPVFNILPGKQGFRYDKRVQLIGGWKADPIRYPNQAIGQVSQGSLGIEFTGKLTDLVLYTKVQSSMPYNFRVFVDGVYNSSVSAFISGPQYLGQNPSNAIADLRNQEAALQPIFFAMGLDPSQVHTVRVEIASDGASPFQLFGMETFYRSGAVEEAGRAFLETDLIKSDSSNSIIAPYAQTFKGYKTVRYIDRTTRQRETATRQALSLVNSGVGISSGASSYQDSLLAPAIQVGDVFSYALADNSQNVFRRVTAVDKGTDTITLDSPLPFSISGVNGRAEHAFRVPAKYSSDGIVFDGPIISAAPPSEDEEEYLRMMPEDWDVGSDRDVSKLASDSAESRVTVLNDGSTSLLVHQCQLVNTGIEGYPSAIRMNPSTSFITIQGWGTRIDGIFTGNSGPVDVTVEIDGMYSYILPLRGDGLERHSFFFKGSPQSHTIKLSSPSIQNRVCLSAIVFHDIKDPEINGTPLSEYSVMRNSTANGLFYDFAPITSSSMTVTSYAGVRVVDITKCQSRIFDGPSDMEHLGNQGTYNWKAVQDFSKNTRFGYYLTTDRPNAILSFVGIGSHFEIYYESKSDGAQANILINGLLATTGNYPSLLTYGSISSGKLDFYESSSSIRRAVLTGLPFGRYEIVIQHAGTRNPSSVAINPNSYPINVFAIAETPVTGSSQKRNLDDLSNKYIKFQSFKDMRQFVTLSPEQGGLIPQEDVSTQAVNALEAVPGMDSGLVNLETMPYWFAVYNDFTLDADPPQSPSSPAYSEVGFTIPTTYHTSPKSVRLGYDCTLGYSLSGGTTLTLNRLPDWAQGSDDVVGSIFQPLDGVDSGKVVRISAAGSGLSFTLEAALNDVVGPLNCAVKQVLHTKDLVQFSSGGVGDSIASRLPIPLPAELVGYISKDINSITVDVEASVLTGSAGFNPVYNTDLVSYQANSKGIRANGSTPNTADPAYWSAPVKIPKYQTQDLPVLYPPGASNNERLFLRFFPSHTSGSGSINILRWAAFLFDDLLSEVNATPPKQWAWGYTDNAQPAKNCTISVVGGKTRIVFPQAYDFNAFPGTTTSSLRVIIDGKELPRETSGVSIIDSRFREIDPFTIELDDDYSVINASIDIRFREQFRSQIKIGQSSPFVWFYGGAISFSSNPVNGARTTFEQRQFKSLKLSALNTGASGSTIVDIYKNGVIQASATLLADGYKNSSLTSVNISANPNDLIEAVISSAATSCNDLTIELG